MRRRLNTRILYATLCLLMIPAGTRISALCNISSSRCFSPPSGYCTSGGCSHVPSTHYYWDYECYPVPCCEQGHCDVYESGGQSGCTYFCYGDNYATCAFMGTCQ